MREYVPISAVQHFVFCPRQCAYIHVDGIWIDNHLTASGNQLHQRVHSCVAEQRGNTRFERKVQVSSEKYGIYGQLDLLEIQSEPYLLTPVEYKRGTPKILDCDRIQLCAQALCLEEMRNVKIPRAAIWYWKIRKREWVDLEKDLRELTKKAIEQTRELLFTSKKIPKAIYRNSCNRCSFFDHCTPKLTDNSNSYLEEIFKSSEEVTQ